MLRVELVNSAEKDGIIILIQKLIKIHGPKKKKELSSKNTKYLAINGLKYRNFYQAGKFFLTLNIGSFIELIIL